MKRFLDPENLCTAGNAAGVICRLGKHPNSFEDREQLGDNAIEQNDLFGAVVEYKTALRIKFDVQVRKK